MAPTSFEKAGPGKQHSFQKSPDMQRKATGMRPEVLGNQHQHFMGGTVNRNRGHIKARPADWPPSQNVTPQTDTNSHIAELFAGCIISVILLTLIITTYQMIVHRNKDRHQDNNSRFRREQKNAIEGENIELQELLYSKDGQDDDDTSATPF